MGLGTQRSDGSFKPITPREGSWAARANDPIPEAIKKAFQDRFPATHSARLRYPIKGSGR